MATGEVYEEAARAMLRAARNREPLQPILKTHCPWIERQLRNVAQYPGFLGMWGRSLNFDEHAGIIIVEPPILELIGEFTGVPRRGRIVHAGLEHTYGYLFSLIDTPYGKKRDRWILPHLDEGLGFQVPTLRDQPQSGTLLLNLTFCLGTIVFRDHPSLLDEIAFRNDPGLPEGLLLQMLHIAPQAFEFPYNELSIRRLVEEAVIPEGRRRGMRIQLFTDLVALPFPRPGESALLIYSVMNGPRLGQQLITAFPVASEYVEEITSSENQGEHVEVRTQYNAYVEGLTGRTVFGRRFLVD